MVADGNLCVLHVEDMNILSRQTIRVDPEEKNELALLDISCLALRSYSSLLPILLISRRQTFVDCINALFSF